jgi:uncharacterized protein (TIGR02611 family)
MTHCRTSRVEGYRVGVSTEEAEGHRRSAVTEKGLSARTRPKGSRAPQFVRRYRALHLTWRVVVLVVGLAIVAAGVAMLVLPGPGWAAIFVGFAVLATEFAWAQRMLAWARKQAAKAAEQALNPQVRRRNVMLATFALVLFAAVVAGYLWRYGSPVATPGWVADLVPGGDR